MINEQELEKIRYHIRLLGETINSEEHPIQALVIRNDWCEDDLENAQDIFEEADMQIQQGKAVDWHAFEERIKTRFGLSYQGVKPIVLAFYHNGLWLDVCKQYAKKYSCAEFNQIK